MKTYKICVLGDFGVGKTSLIRRYVFNDFRNDYHATLGVNLYKFQDEAAADGVLRPINFMIWDVEGATDPGRHAERYIVGAAGAVIVGDATRPNCAAPMRAYAEFFEDSGRPFVFAFNKVDMLGEGADLARRLNPHALTERFGAEAEMTSALSGFNVREMFRRLGERLLRYGV